MKPISHPAKFKRFFHYILSIIDLYSLLYSIKADRFLLHSHVNSLDQNQAYSRKYPNTNSPKKKIMNPEAKTCCFLFSGKHVTIDRQGLHRKILQTHSNTFSFIWIVSWQHNKHRISNINNGTCLRAPHSMSWENVHMQHQFHVQLM